MRAVALTQTDMTDFILRTALREAQLVIEEHERVKLYPTRQPACSGPSGKSASSECEASKSCPSFTATVMRLPDWHEEPISRKHDRDAFDCGDPALNEFLRQHAHKSHDKGAAKTFLAISNSDGKTILGFYSLCPASLEYARVPDVVRKGLAWHDVPVFRLGRLAVNQEFQGQGLGGQPILATGRRCLLTATEVGGVAILIDAKPERAANWYVSSGAVALLDAPLALLVPLATILSRRLERSEQTLAAPISGSRTR
jgi:GNAT superfamily N-acetyltransferase